MGCLSQSTDPCFTRRGSPTSSAAHPRCRLGSASRQRGGLAAFQADAQPVPWQAEERPGAPRTVMARVSRGRHPAPVEPRDSPSASRIIGSKAWAGRRSVQQKGTAFLCYRDVLSKLAMA